MLMLDKKQMRLSFDRAASHYDDSAVLQREVADRLLSRLEMIKYQPRRILDLGCGTGYCAEYLQRRYKKSEYIGMDISSHMVTTARSQHGRWFRRQRWLCADAETIPLADNSIDMVVSNLTLQWCDAPRVFDELARVLRPGGLLMFSSFGPDTLYELRSAWAQVDGYPHVHDFVDMHDLGDMLMRLAYSNPVVDIERLTLTYDNIKSLLLDLKNIGAHNVASRRISGLMGKQHFQNFSEAYRQQFQQEGRLPATYEVIYGHAWAPQQGSTAAQTQSVSLESLKAGAD